MMSAGHFFSPGILNDEACCARIHIKENHEGVEPKENFSPEFFASAEDFVCLICVKKYDGRHNLKSHLVKTHLGLESFEDGKDVMKEYLQSQNPLNGDKEDHLNGGKEDPLNGGKEVPSFEDLDPLTGEVESKENGDYSNTDISTETPDVHEVNIEDIKNKDQNEDTVKDVTSLNDSSDKENNILEADRIQGKEVEAKAKSRVLSDRERELLERMFHNLKKFGCAFCKAR